MPRVVRLPPAPRPRQTDPMTARAARRAASIAAVTLSIVGLSTFGSVGAQAAPAAPDAGTTTSWTIGFGSIGPVDTAMTVKQAIAKLHSGASSKAPTPYCGIFDLAGKSPTERSALTGFAHASGGRLDMLSVGSLFGTTKTPDIPKVVQTAKKIKVGSSLKSLKAAYPGKLKPSTNIYLKVEILPGPKGQAIAFTLNSKNTIINIATGSASYVNRSEYCG